MLKLSNLLTKTLHSTSHQLLAIHTKRRALLYVPGDDERKLNKATKLANIDCVAFDCEDGVAISRKQAARETIVEFLNSSALPTTSTDWAVRVNSVASGLLSDDLKVIFGKDKLVKTVLLPKVDSVEDLKEFVAQMRYARTSSVPVNLIFYAESCRAVMDLPALCASASELSRSTGLFTPVAIVFGSDDLCADLGATRTEDSDEILYARQRVVLVAKAFRLQAIDMVSIDFKDEDALRKQSRQGALMGYTGKQVIHPDQVPIVQESFMPTARKVKWATELLAAFDAYQQSGKGAFVFDNQMIDAPTVKQAQNIIELVKGKKKKK